MNSDELKAKRANSDRVKEFSKKLLNYNKEHSKIAAEREKDDMNVNSEKNPSAREKALEFAKNIPKPKIKLVPRDGRHGRQLAHRDDDYGSFDEENCLGEGIGEVDEFEYLLRNGSNRSKLEELQAKHGENKKKSEAIKRSLGIPS